MAKVTPVLPWLLLAALCVFVGAANAEPTRASAEQCSQWQSRLDKANARLRAGYSNAQGNKLRQRRRDLQTRLYRRCRK